MNVKPFIELAQIYFFLKGQSSMDDEAQEEASAPRYTCKERKPSINEINTLCCTLERGDHSSKSKTDRKSIPPVLVELHLLNEFHNQNFFHNASITA
jgi:hypothetical protein